ncbi:hypothetical protein [Engelhardtia mirabilis]|uniref:RNA polymerase sigma factor n=1 Tax=Engelhardtia mirabilis TaxID=2528011 RepID=A0A518BRI2_9BACT|nr:RNA polymerase sigma factor [Planctomycetes bacterium Pla133]QDV03908.1 RNA polymerase sigma factor [Planctomycetes bacterium Pla86]
MEWNSDRAARDATGLGRELADLRWLGNLALRLVSDPTLADDACQEAWLAASRGGTVAVDRGRLLLGLRRFLWRVRRADGRRLRRERAVAASEALPSTAELLEVGEQRQRVWEHLKALQEPFRSTLLLRFQGELSNAAIARTLDVPADTVRWRVRRGLELLRDSLERDRAGGGLAAIVPALPISIRPDLAPTGATQLAAGTATLGAGVLVMSKLVAALFLGAVTLFVLLDRGPDERASSPAGLTAPLVEPELAMAPVSIEPGGPAVVVAQARREASVFADRSAEPGAAAARLVGRVVDGDGSPRAAVSLHLSGRDWSVSATSALDGSFFLEVPGKGAPRAFLRLEGPPTVQQREVEFSAERSAQWAELDAREGAVTDVGDLVLQDAGVVSGRIVDDQGVGLADAIVLVSGAPQVRSDPDGYFTSDHVEPGERRTTVLAANFLEREMSVEVAALQALQVGEIRLERAPRARGRVLDPSGAPLTGAVVSTRRWAPGWSFEVDQDGRFDVPLPSIEGSILSARAAGYEEPYFGMPVQPGAEGIELVLFPLGPPCRVRLVDDATGEPLAFVVIEVDRFAAEYRTDPTPRLAYAARSERRTDEGWVEFYAQPGSDVLDVAAQGYASRAVVLSERAAGEGQILRLARAPSLSGRVVRDGAPVAGALVVLAQGELGRVEPVREGIDGVEAFDSDPMAAVLRNQDSYSSTSVRGFDGDPAAPAVHLGGIGFTRGPKRRTTTSGEDGRFHFDDLAPLAMRVHARTADDRFARLTELRRAPSGFLDLGDLDLEPTGRIEGRIVGPPARHLAGHSVSIIETGPFEATTDADGAFILDGLPAGNHLLLVQFGESVITRDWATHFHVPLGPGETRAVALELDAEPAATVAVHLRHNGEPAAGAFFELTADAERQWGSGLDGDGRLDLSVPAHVPLRASVDLGSYPIPLGARRSFAEGTNTLELELWSGSLDVELPADLTLPPNARALLQWVAADSPEPTPAQLGTLRSDTPACVHFSVVPEGARQLVLELYAGEGGELIESWPLDIHVPRGVTTRVDPAQSK